MKLNKILMVLAATAIVGCTSDDLNDFSAKQAPEDSRLIELNSDFALAGVGVDGAMTRTHWEQDAVSGALVNKFLPIFNANAAATKKLYDKTTDVSCADLTAQAVGLCWLGNGAVGTDVYTNYQFYHFGWLNKEATEADYACGTLYNGALYSDITLAAATNGAGGEAIPGTDWVPAGLPLKATVNEAGTVDNLNYNSGVYKTDNKAIFGGQYIVYYPFNPDFKEAGTIPAKAKTLFNWNVGLYKPVLPTGPNAWEAPELGDATFRYSAPVTIEGGDEAANFGLYNLSTLVRLRVACPVADANIGDAIDQIVLYSPSEKLLKQANLAADKIVAGQKGADLYAEKDYTKTITTNFVTTATALNVKATTTVSAYITVLPTTVPDLVALVHNATDGTWARVELGNTEFKAGGATALEITVASTDFQSQYIAVDEASLTTALTEAHTAITGDPTLKPTITVIGDIELKATTLNAPIVTPVGTYNINAAADANITITGGDIIVPEGVTLNLNTNMDSKVRVLGTYCCSGAPAGGILNVAGGKISDVTMVPSEARVTPATYDALNPLVKYTGAAEVVAGKTFDVQAGNVYVNEAVEQKEGNIQIAEGAKLIVNQDGLNKGNLSFLGTTVDNYGTIEVKKAGQFYMKNANGTSVWTDGQKMTNHETGKFIHNVDAVVGTAVQFMNQETGSEYRCRVDKQKALDDAYVQWTACSVIEMVNGATLYDLGSVQQHTIWGSLKHVDIEVNNGSGTTKFQKNADGKQINIGNLTVLTPLDVDDQEGGTPKVQRELIVNGDMTVSANTNLKNSKKITVTKNLDINNGAILKYYGIAATPYGVVNGLKVDGNITVTGATFDASDADAIQISCKNFSLVKGNAAATATFGNRTNGNTKKTMEVKGTINNGEGCTFTISPAAGANLLAWITCYKVEGEGTFAGTPTVIAPPTE